MRQSSAYQRKVTILPLLIRRVVVAWRVHTAIFGLGCSSRCNLSRLCSRKREGEINHNKQAPLSSRCVSRQTVLCLAVQYAPCLCWCAVVVFDMSIPLSLSLRNRNLAILIFYFYMWIFFLFKCFFCHPSSLQTYISILGNSRGGGSLASAAYVSSSWCSSDEVIWGAAGGRGRLQEGTWGRWRRRNAWGIVWRSEGAPGDASPWTWGAGGISFIVFDQEALLWFRCAAHSVLSSPHQCKYTRIIPSPSHWRICASWEHKYNQHCSALRLTDKQKLDPFSSVSFLFQSSRCRRSPRGAWIRNKFE